MTSHVHRRFQYGSTEEKSLQGKERQEKIEQ